MIYELILQPEAERHFASGLIYLYREAGVSTGGVSLWSTPHEQRECGVSGR